MWAFAVGQRRRLDDCSLGLSRFSTLSSQFEHLTVVPFNLFEVLFF